MYNFVDDEGPGKQCEEDELFYGSTEIHLETSSKDWNRIHEQFYDVRLSMSWYVLVKAQRIRSWDTGKASVLVKTLLFSKVLTRGLRMLELPLDAD